MTRLEGVKNERGFALIAVFWVIIILSLLALGYATTARFRCQVILNQRQKLTDESLLQSAWERGYYEYLKYNANRTLLEKKDQIEGITNEAVELWYPRYEPYEFVLEGEPVVVRLVNEAGKFHVNNLGTATWERILSACGIPPGEKQTGIINSVRDWIDTDNEHRLNGAENDYYLGLERQYYCKNNEIEVISELLLIKGITLELYNGTDTHPGLVSFLSVYGETEKIDINNAPPEAFSLIDGFSDDSVKAIVRKRCEKPLKRINELSEVVPQEFFSQFTRIFKVAKSTDYLTIAAAKKAVDGQPGRWRQQTVKAGSDN